MDHAYITGVGLLLILVDSFSDWPEVICVSDKKMSMILFTNPSARAGYDTRSIFKRSLTGLNSEFSFSLTSYLTKAEEPSLSYFLPTPTLGQDMTQGQFLSGV